MAGFPWKCQARQHGDQAALFSLPGGLLSLWLLVSCFSSVRAGIRPQSASEGKWLTLPALEFIPSPLPEASENIRIQSFQVAGISFQEKKFIFTCGPQIVFLPMAARVSSCSRCSYICSDSFPVVRKLAVRLVFSGGGNGVKVRSWRSFFLNEENVAF